MKLHLLLHRKIAFSFVVVIVALLTATTPASAKNCSTNCLRVYSIDVSDLGTSIRGIVKLTDESGAGGGARSSVVHAIWTRPDGSSFDQYANIGTRLRAQFSLYTAGAPGTYTLTVADVTKSGYTFDPTGSRILSKSITVGGAANQRPTAISNADVISGGAPLWVNFDSSGSTDPDGEIVAYSWNFGDGDSSSMANPGHWYNGAGSFQATLTVTDDMGATASSSTLITVTEDNAGCTSGCIFVDRISLSFRAKSGTIKGLVWLVDENDQQLKNAVVHAQWTLPGGSTQEQSSDMGGRNKAKFTLDATTAGAYMLRIIEVARPGYEFDPDSSHVLSASIDIAP